MIVALVKRDVCFGIEGIGQGNLLRAVDLRIPPSQFEVTWVYFLGVDLVFHSF